ncbi:GTPase Obg-like isoform X2 [Artemia franciscana]
MNGLKRARFPSAFSLCKLASVTDVSTRERCAYLIRSMASANKMVQIWQGSNDKTTDYAPRALRRIKGKSNLTKVKPVIDFRRISVQAGKGGDGAISLLRLGIHDKAGPDGADGGSGGHVVFRATSNVRSLSSLNTVIRAPNGESGSNRDCIGKNGDHLFVDVPIGTVFKSRDGKIKAELSEEGAMFLAARGGAGGKGNAYFASATNQSPDIAEYGADGESFWYNVELKTIAHVGLVGFPNAGKSTLLQAVSRSRTKVAPYPFTTLQPHIGAVPYEDYEQVMIADIPGLIEGAHEGKGMGIDFLKHIERCMCLLYIIDLTEPEPWRQLEILEHELREYKDELVERPFAVVGNKIDVPEAQENKEVLENYCQQRNIQLFSISAKEGKSLGPLLQYVRSLKDKYGDHV